MKEGKKLNLKNKTTNSNIVKQLINKVITQ